MDREESLIQLLRVNALKRMESSVASFTLTVQRQLDDVQAMLARIEEQAGELEELDITDIDIEDPAFESLLVGRKVKVLLRDVDPVRWRQDLIEDRNRLATLQCCARQVTAEREREARRAAVGSSNESAATRSTREPQDDRVHRLADTARYLYGELAPWRETAWDSNRRWSPAREAIGRR